MYQPTLGRFLSRDPLSENGVDVLTDTGFYSDRLAAMSASPWFYGGNRTQPYVYARNNPVPEHRSERIRLFRLLGGLRKPTRLLCCDCRPNGCLRTSRSEAF